MPDFMYFTEFHSMGKLYMKLNIKKNKQFPVNYSSTLLSHNYLGYFKLLYGAVLKCNYLRMASNRKLINS